jgi:hypothetical protein
MGVVWSSDKAGYEPRMAIYTYKVAPIYRLRARNDRMDEVVVVMGKHGICEVKRVKTVCSCMHPLPVLVSPLPSKRLADPLPPPGYGPFLMKYKPAELFRQFSS